MIDLHIHVLPAVDDGAASPAVTRTMLERSHDQGFTTLVATPHLPEPLPPAYWEKIEAAYVQTRQWGSAIGVDVRLGFEVPLTTDLSARLAQGEPSTLAGSRAVLVDLPFAGWPHHTAETLFALQTTEFRPVLAHPERYPTIQREPGHAIEMARRGIVLQVTIGSFAGLFGKAAQATAERLLAAGAVHLVATDAHSTGRRYDAVPAGLTRLRHLIGEDGVRSLLTDAPQALLNDGPLPIPLRTVARHRLVWSRWGGSRR